MTEIVNKGGKKKIIEKREKRLKNCHLMCTLWTVNDVQGKDPLRKTPEKKPPRGDYRGLRCLSKASFT